MSAINNLVRASKKSVTASVNTVGLGTELLADGIELGNDIVTHAKPVLKAILSLPFSSAKGYLIQEGASEEEADARAYKYIRQDIAVTIEAVGVGSGKLLSAALKEDDDVVSTDSNKS
jgi:hypothetical protein